MNIQQFCKLSKVEDKELLAVALFWLLDINHDTLDEDYERFGLGEVPDFTDSEYANLSPELQAKYKTLILDLCDLPLEDYDRLFAYVKKEGIEDLSEWLRENEYRYLDTDQFEIFKPLTKSYLFREYLNVDDVTGEVQIYIQEVEENILLRNQLIQIMQFEQTGE